MLISFVQRPVPNEGLPNADVTIEQVPRFYVACFADGSIMACAAIEQYGTDALPRSVAVADAARRDGLGWALVATVERDATDSGVRRLYLLTTTAVSYFARLGYRDFDRQAAPSQIQSTSQFASLCPASAICMAKRL